VFSSCARAGATHDKATIEATVNFAAIFIFVLPEQDEFLRDIDLIERCNAQPLSDREPVNMWCRFDGALINRACEL
jgi:hypothetical protein